MTAPFIDLSVHHNPKGLSDRVAYGFTKALRWCADTFFAERYGHRAVVLETVAAVPGMVGATVNHGEYIYFRWQGGDVSGTLNRDEFAIGSFSLTAINPVPEPSAVLLVVASGLGAVRLARRRLTRASRD